MPYYQDCSCCLVKVHKRDVKRFEAEESFRRKYDSVSVYFPDSDDEDEVAPIQPAAIRAKANHQ